MSDLASQSVTPPLDTTDKERRWSERFLDLRIQHMERFPARAPAWEKRVDRLREHVRAGDWDLTPQAFASGAGNTSTASGTNK